MVLHHHHPLPTTPIVEERCRHLAVQTIVMNVCLDCSTPVSATESITGLPVRGDLSDLPMYFKP